MFDPKTLEATSFNWWYFVKKIGGKVVFNEYRYSSYTTRHQRKVERLMEQLGIKVDVVVEAPKGLQNLSDAIEHHEYQIRELIGAMQRPRTQKAKNAWRAERVRELQARVKTLRKLAKESVND